MESLLHPLSVLKPDEFKVDPHLWEALLSFFSASQVAALYLLGADQQWHTLWLGKRPVVTDIHQGPEPRSQVFIMWRFVTLVR